MKYMSPLQELIAIEHDAREFGFEWPHKEMIVDQAISECHEILDAIDNHESPQRLQEEIGDLLHTAISLCLFAGFDVEDTLAKTSKKFATRIYAVKELTKQHGLSDLVDQSIDFKLGLWHKAKLAEK